VVTLVTDGSGASAWIWIGGYVKKLAQIGSYNHI